MYITVLLSSLFFVSGCGGGGSSTNWGIDAGYSPLAVCQNNSDDAIEAGAIEVPAGTKVQKLSSDAVVRIWHFENSREAVCLLKGDAVIKIADGGSVK